MKKLFASKSTKNLILVILLGIVFASPNTIQAQLQRKTLGNNSRSSTNNEINVGDKLTTAFDKFGNLALHHQKYDIEGYPCIQFQVGASHTYGDYTRLKFCIGDYAGLVLYGGIGKEWIFNSEYKNRLTWHAGCGYYLETTDGQDLTWVINYAQSPLCKKGSLNMDIYYSFFFGESRIFGLFFGGGLGATEHPEDKEKAKLLWNAELGIAIKLWQKH